MILTCTMPMKNVLGNFIGCVTIDMDLAAVQNLVAELQVGETGSAMILDGDTGMYIGCTDAAKVDAGASILEEESASLVQAGQQILDAESGIISYTAGGESYQAYFDTMSEVNWKLVMQVPQSELDEPIVELVERLIIVGIIAIIISILAILRQVRNISGSIRKVQNFAGTLAEGDFSVPQLVVKSKDELGRMSTSLNAMYDSNKSVLMGISTQAGEIRESSVSLNQSAEQLRHQFENITELMTDVNEAMQSASAAAQQVNASAEEVSSSVNLLAGETEKSRSTTEEIKERAKNVENSSKEAYASALRLSSEYERNLSKSIENAQIVESIGQMAEVISGIAGQINLLSLNASIEAARVGEAGKGFAVVASEIGKLAGETSAAVENIQKTIDNIREAFELLTNDSKSLIAFLKETVTPDYDKFVGVAKQYGDDAVTIEEISSRISDMAENIENIMSEVTNAVQNIAESVQSTADDSSQITNTMEQVTGVVEQVSEMSEDQEKIAGSLNEVVNKFKLE
jgi:methyl-accepting chemotaxis protein